MTPLDWLAVLLIVGCPLNWLIALFLARLSDKHPNVPTLRSRAIAQIVLAVITSIGGLLGAIELGDLRLAITTPLLAVGFVLPYVPGVWWTITYLNDGFE